MIDIKAMIHTRVATRVREAFPGVLVTGRRLLAPETFPAVSVVEVSNVAYERTATTDSAENHARVIYEISIYSNSVVDAESEARAIASVIDATLSGIGFTRIMLEPIDNAEDAAVFRLVGRYAAVVGTDYTIYRR